jgi:hypothetical protein
MILIGKEPINKKKSITTKSYSTSTVAPDELDDNDDTDDRDCAELVNYDLMDVDVAEETPQITKRAGRIANKRYNFGTPKRLNYSVESDLLKQHPQSTTHVQYSLSLLKVPLLSVNL